MTRKIITLLGLCIVFLLPITQAYGATNKEIVCSPLTGYCIGFDNNIISIYNSSNSTLATMDFNECTNGQTLTFQTSNSTWICSSVNSDVDAFLSSLNGDTTAAQKIVRTYSNNTEIVNSTGKVSISIKPNAVLTNGSAQTVTKTLTLNSLTLGGQMNLAGNTLLNTGTITFPTSTTTLGGLALTQSWTGNNTMKFGSGGIIIRNPASTFTTTINNVAITANRTINLPLLTGSDTFATLGLAQTFSGTDTFSNQATIKGLSLNNVTKYTTYSIVSTDGLILADATGGAFTITLPTAASPNVGHIYAVKKIDKALANVITIATTSSQTIDLLNNFNLTQRDETVVLYSDGFNWQLISDLPSPTDTLYHSKGSTLNRWYSSAVDQFATTTGTASTVNLIATPFIVSRVSTFDQIAIDVTTLGSGSTCRASIYSDNGNTYPFLEIKNSDVGTFDASATGRKVNTFASTITLQPALYWLAAECSATAPSLVFLAPTSIPDVLGQSSSTGASAGGVGWTVANTFGVLPTTFPAGATVTTSNVPEVLVRQLS